MDKCIMVTFNKDTLIINKCIMDTCIMDACIVDTCIVDSCIIDTCIARIKHKEEETEVSYAWITRPECPKGPSTLLMFNIFLSGLNRILYFISSFQFKSGRNFSFVAEFIWNSFLIAGSHTPTTHSLVGGENWDENNWTGQSAICIWPFRILDCFKPYGSCKSKCDKKTFDCTVCRNSYRSLSHTLLLTHL